MRINNSEDPHLRDLRPIQPPVRLTRCFGMVRHQQQATRMLNIHRDLLGTVARKLMGSQLRQEAERFQSFSGPQIIQSLTNASAIVRTIFPEDGLLVRQLFGELRV